MLAIALDICEEIEVMTVSLYDHARRVGAQTTVLAEQHTHCAAV